MEQYYVVKNGWEPGIFTSWEQTKKNVDGFKNAIYRRFNTYDEADEYYNDPISFTYNDDEIFIKFQSKSKSFKFKSNNIEEELREFTDNIEIRNRLTEIIQELLTDRIEKNFDGIEDTEMDSDDFILQPYDPDQVKYIAKPFSVGTLHNYITGFDGEEEPTIDMRPGFQRNFVWSNKAKSSLIESILLNIPI